MYGAILGDMIGSPYEFDRGNKRKDFPLFSDKSTFTDDTVMTLAVAEAIMKRYGQLLINDGLCRFGFGSHSEQEEIYCLKYQVLSVYGEQKKFKK